MIQKKSYSQVLVVTYANSRGTHPSIVANSVESAIEGEFGNHHATQRTRGSELFINPLMSLYWFFDLDKRRRSKKISIDLSNRIQVDRLGYK